MKKNLGVALTGCVELLFVRRAMPLIGHMKGKVKKGNAPTLLNKPWPLYILTLLLLILFQVKIMAQHTDLVDSSQTQVLADTSKSYLIPDMRRTKKTWTQFSTKWFSMQLGAAPIFDYTFFMQDSDSKKQVSKQENKYDLRSGRFSVRGKILFKNPWTYFVSAEYHGLDRDKDESAFGFTDISLGIPLGRITTMTIGKIKETFSYEMVGDAANLPHMERILSPFFVSRNTGITLKNTFLRDRMSWAVGWFNNWLAKDKSFNDAANTFTARITGLPVYAGAAQFIHMGASVRYVEAENDALRLKGRNESNVTDYYVDTKDIPGAQHEINLGLEQLWSVKNFSILFEYIHSWVNTVTGNDQFNGYYITGSWVISGEERPYDKKAGYARRVMPDGRGGAWEVVARASRVDLTDKQIQGGILHKLMFGLNWWATQHWKTGFAYGISGLDKDNILGLTNSLQFRIQWIF